MTMTKEEYGNKYQTLKFQEMFEPDEDKRKEISKQIKTLETTYKRGAIKQSELDSMFEETSIDNNENVQVNANKELTGGAVK